MGMSLDDDDYLPDFLKEDSVVESPFGLDDMVMPSDYEWPYLIDDFSVENILKLNKEGKNPNNTLTGIQWRALGKIKDNLYNWDNEPGFSDIFHKEFCKKYDISLSVLKALEKKGLIKLSKDDYYFKERGYIVYPKPLMYLVYISEQDYPDWFIPEAKEKGLWKAESKKMNPLEKAGISGMASGATMEGLETLLAAEEFSKEDLEAYFADLKKNNPKLAKIIEFKVKNEEYLPKKLIESSGYDYEILNEWYDYVIDDDKYALFDPCPACEGEGWIMTSYTPATRFEPADGDGEDCGECGGSGKIDPSDYMYYDDKGEIEYAAETFDDMKIKYDNRDRIFFIKSVDYDTDGEIENDELPQEFTIKIPSEYHYFDEDADEGDITDVLNEWISTETGFSTKGIVWVEEENNSWRKNAEYDEEDMVSCNHCWDEIGNEKEVYGDETVEYEMANGELVCIPCYKIWMKEYKNDLDPHYSPFYAESFEAAEWVGFCPECNKWRTKEMSVKIDSKINTTGWSIPDKLLGKRLCKKSQRFGKIRQSGDTFTGYGSRGFDDSYCGTPLTKVKSKYKAEAEETKSMNPYLLGAGIFALTLGILSRKL